MGTYQDFSTHLINGLGSCWGILNPFKFNTNTSLIRYDLLSSSKSSTLLLMMGKPKLNAFHRLARPTQKAEVCPIPDTLPWKHKSTLRHPKRKQRIYITCMPITNSIAYNASKPDSYIPKKYEKQKLITKDNSVDRTFSWCSMWKTEERQDLKPQKRIQPYWISFANMISASDTRIKCSADNLRTVG